MDVGRQQGDGLLSYVSISGVLSLLGSAGLYYLGNTVLRDAQELEKAKQLDKLSDVKSLARLVPLLVAVTGRVGSLNPRQCELSDKQAVLYEVLEQDVFQSTNNAGGISKEYYTTRRERGDTDWFLMDDEASTMLRVDNSRFLHVEGSTYELKERYEPRNSSWTQAIVHQAIKAAQLVGSVKKEKFVPVGTVLTVVGELARSSVSPAGFPVPKGPAAQLALRKPLEGPFLATNRSLQQLQDELWTVARRLRLCAFALGAVGAALLASKLGRRLYRRWLVWSAKERMRRELQQRRVARAAQAGGARGQGGDEEEEEEEEEGAEGAACTVCMENALDVVWVPCGHLCLCQSCMASVDRCPLCRSTGRAIKVYRA